MNDELHNYMAAGMTAVTYKLADINKVFETIKQVIKHSEA